MMLLKYSLIAFIALLGAANASTVLIEEHANESLKQRYQRLINEESNEEIIARTHLRDLNMELWAWHKTNIFTFRNQNDLQATRQEVAKALFLTSLLPDVGSAIGSVVNKIHQANEQNLLDYVTHLKNIFDVACDVWKDAGDYPKIDQASTNMSSFARKVYLALGYIQD